jgi:hypothetical protein
MILRFSARQKNEVPGGRKSPRPQEPGEEYARFRPDRQHPAREGEAPAEPRESGPGRAVVFGTEPAVEEQGRQERS